jgi:hypothetical protein
VRSAGGVGQEFDQWIKTAAAKSEKLTIKVTAVAPPKTKSNVDRRIG